VPTSLIDVLDSAVKIGLGALISGFATYSVTRLKYRQEVQQNIRTRRREIIEEASEHMEKFNEYSHECSNVIFAVIKRVKEPVELRIAANELSKGLSYITKSIGRIQLLGEKQLVDKLYAYKKIVVELINYVNNCSTKDSSHCDIEKYNNLIDSISEEKKEVMQELSKSYLNITA